MSHQRSNTNNTADAAMRWQNALNSACAEYQIANPVFREVSDRRGGRTAWSSVVSVYGNQFSARFWYDGKNVNNAREDAAEVALSWLQTGGESNSPASNRSYR